MSRSKKKQGARDNTSRGITKSSGTNKSSFQRLIESSPTRIESFPSDPHEFLMKTGLAKGLVCLGEGYWNCETDSISNFNKPLTELGVCVPATMKNRYGKKAGALEVSQRTNDNIGSLLFVVVAPQVESRNEQARSIMELKRMAPLVAVVQRDHANLEAWFSIKGWSSMRIQNFRAAARNLGAPKDIFINCQPYALPGGWNHRDQVRQELVYWDPSAV